MVVWIALLGCDDGVGVDRFQPAGSFDRQTRGLVLHDDGLKGHAGMKGTNCPFDVSTGQVTGDYDLPGSREEVQDVGIIHGFGPETVVLTQPDVVFLLNKLPGVYMPHGEVAVPGLLDVSVADGGIVTVSHGCEVAFHDLIGDPEVVEACGTVVGGDDRSQTAVVGGGAVSVVTPDEVVQTDVLADLVVWDPVTDLAYVATRDGDTVTALDAQGTVLWERVLEGWIKDLDSGGLAEAAVVSLQRYDGTGEVVYLGAMTGDEVSSLSVPGLSQELTVNASGGLIGLIREHQTVFFRVRSLGHGQSTPTY